MDVVDDRAVGELDFAHTARGGSLLVNDLALFPRAIAAETVALVWVRSGSQPCASTHLPIQRAGGGTGISAWSSFWSGSRASYKGMPAVRVR